ncbi:MAG: right-handed parallel beta-helix repeat-containing protein [Bacteroidales bacterium]|nr:right-handed parallel beta-helix repeat-containing protein [Bacteroidales bacterium]
MKWKLVILLINSFIFNTIYCQNNCNFYIPTSQNVVNGESIPAGSIICIEPGLRSYLLIQNVKGTHELPIIIINHNGRSILDTDHFYGIKFSGCNHVRLTGSGNDNDFYGIKINKVLNGAGISIDDMSSDIEVDRIEVANTLIGGIYAKTDPSCTNFQSTRDKFTMYNIKIHDCYLHDIGDEGFYVGSSKFTGQYLANCDTTVFPHVIEGVEIYNNLIERTGWDGLQVSSAVKDCFIYNNTIRFDSQKETTYQMSGILIGGGSTCDCYNNTIIDGKGDGIDVFGSFSMNIYNNLVVRAGKSFQPNDPAQSKHGIFIGNTPDQSVAIIRLIHNTIVSPKTTGIRFFNNNTINNLIVNNIIVDPGALIDLNEKAYFDHNLGLSQYVYADNFLAEGLTTVKFVEHTTGNFDLKPDSPAVNRARESDVLFDINDAPRPHNQLPDIGAYECQDTYASVSGLEGENTDELLLVPNPATDKLKILIRDKDLKIDHIIIHSSLGNTFIINKNQIIQMDQGVMELNIEMLPQGPYLIEVPKGQQSILRKFIKIK